MNGSGHPIDDKYASTVSWLHRLQQRKKAQIGTWRKGEIGEIGERRSLWTLKPNPKT